MEQGIESATKSKLEGEDTINVSTTSSRFFATTKDNVIAQLLQAKEEKELSNIVGDAHLPSEVILHIEKIKLSIKESDYLLQAETFIKLGDYYAQQQEYLYAASIYNYVLNVYRYKINNHPDKEQHIIEKLVALEAAFLVSLNTAVKENPAPYSKVNIKHRKYLTELREKCKQQLAKIDEQYPFSIYKNEKNEGYEETYQQLQLKKAEAVRGLYHQIAENIKRFVRELIEESIASLGQPPCEYAVIGLGSLAREEATPYSDLEFAILIAEEKEDYKIYFRNLTRLLHLKVINLGETILPSLGIPALNNYYSRNASANWFYDEITPRGFAFDGSMPQACKTPLGKRDQQENLIYELIHNPEVMVQFFGKKADNPNGNYWFDHEPHLTMILTTTDLIAGHSHLWQEYQKTVTVALQQLHRVENIPLHQVWAMSLLKGEQLDDSSSGLISLQQKAKIKGDIQEFEMNPQNSEEEGKLYNVKKDIYRFPDRVLERLVIYYGIHKQTAWDRIEAMRVQGNIQTNAAMHLKIVTGIATELRLRTYLAQGGQYEKMLMDIDLASGETTNLEKIQNFFQIPNLPQLFRFYYTALPFYEKVVDFCSKKPNSAQNFFLKENFFDCSALNEGIINKRLMQYQTAIDCFMKSIKNEPPRGALDRLMECFEAQGNYYHVNQWAKKELNNVLQHPEKYENHQEIIMICANYIGGAYLKLEHYDSALQYLQLAFEFARKIFDKDSPKICRHLNNFALVLQKLDRLDEALELHLECLTINQKYYGEKHPYVSRDWHNLSFIYKAKKQHDEAIKCLQKAIVIDTEIYGEDHPRLADYFNALGGVYLGAKNYQEAIKYHRLALAIRLNHPDSGFNKVPSSYNNLGVVHDSIGESQYAIDECYEKALKFIGKYCQGGKPPIFAEIKHNEGTAYATLGEYNKAITNYNEALDYYQKTYDNKHPGVRETLCSLRNIYLIQNNFEAVITCLEKDILFSKQFYGENHLEVAIALSNLGAMLCEFNKEDTQIVHSKLFLNGTNYIKQAYLIFISQSLSKKYQYEITTSLHACAVVLNNSAMKLIIELGLNSSSRSYQDEAFSYLKEALEVTLLLTHDTQITLQDPQITPNVILGNFAIFDAILRKQENTYRSRNDNVKLKDCLEQLLAIRKIISKNRDLMDDKFNISPHIVAVTAINLGQVWIDLDDLIKGVAYLREGLALLPKDHPSFNDVQAMLYHYQAFITDADLQQTTSASEEVAQAEDESKVKNTRNAEVSGSLSDEDLELAAALALSLNLNSNKVSSPYRSADLLTQYSAIYTQEEKVAKASEDMPTLIDVPKEEDAELAAAIELSLKKN